MSTSNPLDQRRSTPPPPQAPQKSEPWKQHFAALRSQTSRRAAEWVDSERRIIYIIDPIESADRQGLVLRAALCHRKKNGEWGKPSLDENWIPDPHQLDPDDRKILG